MIVKVTLLAVLGATLAMAYKRKGEAMREKLKKIRVHARDLRRR